MNTKNKRSISSIKKTRPAIYKLILFFYIYTYTTATLDDIKINSDDTAQIDTSKNQNNLEMKPSQNSSLKNTPEDNSIEFSNLDEQSYEWDYSQCELVGSQEDNTQLVDLDPLLKNDLNLKLEEVFNSLYWLNEDIQNEYSTLINIRKKIEKLDKLVNERLIEEKILLAYLKIAKERYFRRE
ncbi:hypothetical protein NEAUS03_1779 [Nematocida ausubeli]|nr:hypothetical protein NEAUS03_1779 [Nematocida ausubeli]